MSTYTSHRATRRPLFYKGEHRRHNGRRKSFLSASLATLLAAAFTVSCAGNPAVEPTPAPGPPVSTGRAPAPQDVQVALR